MNILNIIKLVVALSPEVLQLVESLIGAFKSLAPEHQTAITQNINAVAEKYSKK